MARAHGEAFTGDVVARLQTLCSSLAQNEAAETSAQTATLGDHLVAVSHGNTIFVIDIATLNTVVELAAEGRAPVQRLAWAPECARCGGGGGTPAALRLAAVDTDGLIAVWSVHSAERIAVCDANASSKQGAQGAMLDLAWATAVPDTLVALLEPATLLFVHASTGAALRSYSLAAGAVLTGIEVNPWDRTSLAMTSASGAVLLGSVAAPDAAVSGRQIALPDVGAGLAQARWVPNRGVLLLLYAECLIVYDTELGTVMERVALPRRCRPFKRWLAAEGGGACLGNADEGALSTLVVEHEGGAVSVWHDKDGSAQHMLYAYHDLQPPMHSDALGPHAAVLALAPVAPPRGRAEASGERCMALIAVMQRGQLWKWSLPLPDLPRAPALASAVELSRDFLSMTSRSQRLSSMPSMNLLQFASPNTSQTHNVLELGAPALINTPSLPTLPEIPAAEPPARPGSSPPAPTSPEPSAFARAQPGAEDGPSWNLDELTQPLGAESSVDFTAPTTPAGSTTQLLKQQHKSLSGTGLTMAAAAAAALASEAAAPGAARAAELLHVRTGLPGNATTLAVLPVLVPTGPIEVARRLPVAPETPGREGVRTQTATVVPPTQSQLGAPHEGGGTPQAVALLAAGTAQGSVEVLAVTRASFQPLAISVVQSFKVSSCRVASVQWLGCTLRFAAISIDTAHAKGAAAPSYRTTVTVTDVASHATQTLFTDAWKTEPYVTLRACPIGRYLLVIPREGATQVWSVPIGAAAALVRPLPLQFTALAWVAPPHMAFGACETFSPRLEEEAARSPPTDAAPAAINVQPSPPRSANGAASPLARTSSATQPAAGSPPEGEPSSAFVFSVRDGRLGSISVSDRTATKRIVSAPRWSVQYVDQLAVTAMVATGPLVFIGDGSGVLYQWSTDTGETRIIPVAKKGIRRLQLAPPPPPALGGADDGAQGRVLILFGDGTFTVWEVDRDFALTPSGFRSSTQSPVGRVADSAWLPLAAPVGGGAVAAVLAHPGVVTLLDVAQARGARPMRRARAEALRQALGGGERRRAEKQLLDVGDDDEAPAEGAAGMAPGPVCESALCLAPARLALLQLLIQAGTPASVLRDVCQPDDAAAQRGAHALLCHIFTISDAVTTNTRPSSGGAGAVSSDDSARGGAEALKRDVGNLVKQPSDCTAMLAEHEDIELLRSFRLDRLVAVLRECAAQRTGDAATLLSEREHAALVAAIELDDPILRACACMGAAAGLLDPAQARFWRKLPATLAAHVGRVAEADLGGRAPMRAAGLRRRAAALATERPLYAADAIVREATQRLQWHERAHGGGFGEGEGGEEDAEGARLHDRRVLEYTCIGDYEMAVGLAMASPPAMTMAFYRNSLLTVAAASAARFQRGAAAAPAAPGATGAAGPPGAAQANSAGEQFALQALKVVAEHARSVGDVVTGVVLLCSAGRFLDAVGHLQACADWPCAITLAAHTLTVPQRNALLHAWAQLLVRRSPGAEHTWHIVGLFAAAGSLRSAAAALRAAGAAMHASVLTTACTRLGLTERVVCAPPKAPPVATAAAAPPEPPSEAAVRGESGDIMSRTVSRADSVFIEPPPDALARARTGTLNAIDLLAQPPGLQPVTPSDSECAEVGSEREESPRQPAPRPESLERVVSGGVGPPVAAGVSVPNGEGEGAGSEAASEGAAVEWEVLVNLDAPAATVRARGRASEDAGGRAGVARGGASEVVTEADDTARARAALRRHAIDVLSEALASEAWL